MDRSTKLFAIIGGVIGLMSSLAVIVFLILGLIGIFPLENSGVNLYHITFIADEQVLMDEYVQKGELINTDFVIPVKPDDEFAYDYEFSGWDTNGDHIANLIPTRAYRTFTAVAIYKGTQRVIVSSEETSVEPSSETPWRPPFL